jgi:cell division septum initiation protein DivIVA
MTENAGILELVDMLYNMISDAWGVPLGNDKCLVDREKALDLIEAIKNQLPAEITEAKRLVSRRDDFINNAKREGEAIRKAAEEQSRKMMEEQQIVKMAQARAQELVATAENKSRELRRAANEYIDEALKGAEDAMSQALGAVQQSRARYRSAAGGYSKTASAAASNKEGFSLDE